MKTYIKTFLKKYICFSGRVARKKYFMFQFKLVLLVSIIQGLVYLIYRAWYDVTQNKILLFIFSLLFYVITVRRLHDLNCSGWWNLLSNLLGLLVGLLLEYSNAYLCALMLCLINLVFSLYSSYLKKAQKEKTALDQTH